jgi:uncharacterized membrane protein YccC
MTRVPPLAPLRRLPAYAINGIAVALGIGLIQLAFGAFAGAQAAQLVVSGATCASLADVPNRASRTSERVAIAAALSFVAALVIDLLRPHPYALGVGVAAIAFGAMMVMSWGARAGAVAFAPVLSTVFSMAVPPSGHPLGVAALSACGGIAYLGWSTVSARACEPRYRTLALVAALRATADLFRSRAGVLEARRRADGDSAPLQAWVRGETALAERLQAARDLVFPATRSRHWERDTAMLLRAIELRDLLIASPLDIELLGTDEAARTILTEVADALRAIGAAIDAAADALRDGRHAQPRPQPPIDVSGRLAGVALTQDDPRTRLVPVLVRRQQRMVDDAARLHRLLRGEAAPALPLSGTELQRFVSPESWSLRALRAQWQLESTVLRHAIRMGIALGAAYYIEFALPWGSHPYWLVLSVAVVLRGTLGDTLARRNARVAGTLLGCLIVVVLAGLRSTDVLRVLYLGALGTAHAFATQRYWLTATAASVMALLQANLVSPGGGGFAIAERIADTVVGALLAWCASFVLPSWERRRARETIATIFRDLDRYAQHSLAADAGDPVAERLWRRKAYDSLALLGLALERSAAEPARVRLPIAEAAALLDQGGRLMAHLAAIRMSLAQIDAQGERAAIAGLLVEARANLAATLDLGSPAPSRAQIPVAELELLPERPPGQDARPWLARRLKLLVDDATRMRAAVDDPTLRG